MPARGPKGTVTRLVPDWLSATMMGGQGSEAGAAGFFPAVELFNNATDGSYLWVYGVDARADAGITVELRSYFGQLANHVGSQAPLQFDQPIGPGIVMSYCPVTKSGVVFYALYSATARTFWPYSYPVAKIPPGYSIAATVDATNQTLRAAFIWAPISGQ